MSEKEIINFKIKGKWTLNDMTDLLTSINQIYNAVYAINIKQLEINMIIKSLAENFDDYCSYWIKHLDRSSLFKEFWRIWTEISREYITQKRSYPSFLLPWFYPLITTDISKIIEIDAIQIYKNIDTYIYPEQRLFIRKIVMESPGVITFEGSGEIIKQIRELIKDLWYRNRLEKQEKEIELKIKKMDFAKSLEEILRKQNYRQFIKPENELIEIIINGVNKLEQLEKDEKLENVPENLEKIKKKCTAPQKLDTCESNK